MKIKPKRDMLIKNEKHKDEKEDRALIKKMVKKKDLK